MNKYIYVDTENTGLKFIELIKNMDKSWRVFVFYTDHSPRIPFDNMNEIRSLECDLEFIRCFNGTPNALDFSLVTQLGLSVAKRPKSFHIIISDDNGFDASLKMLDTIGYKVGRYSILNGFILFQEYQDDFSDIIEKFNTGNNVKLSINNVHKIIEIELVKIGLAENELEFIKGSIESFILDKVLVWDILLRNIEQFKLFQGAVGKNHCNTLRQRLTNRLQTYGYRVD